MDRFTKIICAVYIILLVIFLSAELYLIYTLFQILKFALTV